LSNVDEVDLELDFSDCACDDSWYGGKVDIDDAGPDGRMGIFFLGFFKIVINTERLSC